MTTELVQLVPSLNCNPPILESIGGSDFGSHWPVDAKFDIAATIYDKKACTKTCFC